MSEKDDKLKSINHFEVTDVIGYEEFAKKGRTRINESDLCLTFPQGIVQFKHNPKTDSDMITMNPGIYSIINVDGVELKHTTLKIDNLLESVDNTNKILEEYKIFFDRLDIYKELGLQPKRAILLYGPPGTGKSSSINRVIHKMTDGRDDSVVLLWNTSQVKPEAVYNLLNFRLQYTDKCKRVLLVMEDIGGIESTYSDYKYASASMLNLLDGIDITFKLPTFIMATTNNPNNLVESLADRPGRFDKLVKMGYPSADEKVNLVAFIAKRELTESEMKALRSKSAEDFSIAHLKELVVRSKISDKKIEDIVEEMSKHKELLKNDFQHVSKRMGLGQ